MARIAGIDLGTSTSEIAVLESGAARVLRNPQGNAVTPSAIWENPSTGELVRGDVAYRKGGAALQFKREMGTNTTIAVGSKHLRPEECSALILRELKEYAEAELGEVIDRAVITVPANWKDGPRRATEAAGRLAGFTVERLINEPTAAAMAFGVRPDAEGKTIAVYDLGGGTFDVTILRIQGRVFDVLTTSGDKHLGGSDIDRLLMKFVEEQFRAAHGFFPDLDPRGQVVADLRNECETRKKELSFGKETEIRLPAFAFRDNRPVGIEVSLTRARLDQLANPLIERTIEYFKSAIRAAGLPKEQIDEIILVGGATRMPLVRQRVAEFIGKEPNSRAVNPDEAVALGAAIQAGIIDQDEVTDDAFVILDVATNTLGVEALGFVNNQPIPNLFSPIIKKDTKLPTRATATYLTTHDNQEAVDVRCFQGEGPIVNPQHHQRVGESILIQGLPPRRAGEVEVDVTFGLNLNGMLEVGVGIRGTNLQENRQFALAGASHTEEALAASKATLDQMWRRSSLANKYKVLIERTQETVRKGIRDDSRESVEDALQELKDAVSMGDDARAEKADLKLTDLLFDLE